MEENPSRLEAEVMRRLKEWIRSHGGAQHVADVTGIPIGTLTKNLSGQTKASFGTIMTIIEKMQIEPTLVIPSPHPPKKTLEIIEEAADLFRRQQKARGVRGGTDPAEPTMIRLPVYSDVRAAAGPGASPVSERVDSMISFDPRFLRDHGAVPERCSVIWAHGDSMMPTIPDGSALIVDRSQTEVKNGSIMVIGIGDDLLVKRVRRRLDGLIDLISDNQAYAPETLGPDTLQQLRVIGRVVYFCRTP